MPPNKKAQKARTIQQSGPTPHPFTNLPHRQIDTQIHIYTDTHIYRYTDTQIHRYTDTHIHIYTYTQIHRYTDTQIHRYTDTQIHIYIDTYIHIYIYTHIHIYTYTHIHGYTYTHIHRYTEKEKDTPHVLLILDMRQSCGNAAPIWQQTWCNPAARILDKRDTYCTNIIVESKSNHN